MKQTSQLNKKSSQRFPWQVVKNLLLLLFSPVQVFETGGSSALCCLSEFAQNTPTESVMLSNLLILHPSLLFCLQSLPASGFFFFLPMSWFFTPGGQSIGASPSATILSMNIPGWFPLELTGLISLQSKGLSRSFSSITIGMQHSASSIVQLSDPYMTTGKTIALTMWPFVSKVMSLLFNAPV